MQSSLCISDIVDALWKLLIPFWILFWYSWYIQNCGCSLKMLEHFRNSSTLKKFLVSGIFDGYQKFKILGVSEILCTNSQCVSEILELLKILSVFGVVEQNDCMEANQKFGRTKLDNADPLSPSPGILNLQCPSPLRAWGAFQKFRYATVCF